ncbi:MAG: response regulator [Proteobacteria bacterium]|nr:MAG: response regulator [Pseudomonadota bacterium]
MSHKNKNLADRSIRRQVEAITRKKLASQDIVHLGDFRNLKKDQYQPTILVVDDEEIMRSALKRILESENYKVILADDAMGLTKVLDSTQFDLILLDINMPWVDGIELCAMLKGHPSLSHVPLILVSGRKSKEDIEKGFAAGCDDYITKPFEVDHILNLVSKALIPVGLAK